MNIQTKIRLDKMKEMLEEGKTMEVGISEHRITNGLSLDCVESLNPDLLCDLNKEAIPLDDEKVDVVVAGEILEHLINPFNAVREFYRVLKENGTLIVSVPNICSLVNRFKMLFGKLPLNCAEPVDDETPERHITDFNLKVLKEVIEKAGFKIEEMKSNGLITHSRLITRYVPAGMGETLIIKARK